MKTMKPTFIMGMLAICMGMMSCQDDEDTNISTIKPGTYSADIIVNSESGSTNYSRGINVEKGMFTSTYDQDYIYLHRVESKGNKTYTELESLYIPMEKDCGENKCFNIQVIVKDNNTYTITTKNKEGASQSITLYEDEKIYFSTMEGPEWSSQTLPNESPIKGQIFEQPTDEAGVKSREILKSDFYTGSQLSELITGDPPQYIDLTRHVTGFKIHILFTNANVTEDQPHTITIDEWNEVLKLNGDNTFENFKIKIYFGPNFAQWYDILNDKSEGFGYYASNNQTYVPFEKVNQTYKDIAYTGYGYNTTNTLLSPLYLEAANEEFRIYMCIKYKDKDKEGQEFYTVIRPRNLTMNTNTIHHMILAFDVHDLIPIVTGEGGTYSTRSSSSTFQKIDIKPIKVICN